MNEKNMKKFHPELTEYYQKGDCCTWIVELRKQVSEKDKQIKYLQNLIDKATSLYLKELSEKGKVDDLACKMFNTLEGNI